MQSYMTLSFALFAMSFGVAAYAWQAPTDEAPRVALLTNTKPVKEDVVALMERSGRIVEQEVVISTLPSDNLETLAPENSLFADVITLPNEFDQFDPTVDLNLDTELGSIEFSTEISDAYTAVNPTTVFPEGPFTLYATFAYNAMENGMEWAWVWRHNGQVVDGGNELWQYGNAGPGYIFFAPEEGFQLGDYSLEVWVNGELLTQSSALMNNAAAAASR
ncbi:MAG: hypothetical protein AAF614_05550 [Chloroflexota bacterium]